MAHHRPRGRHRKPKERSPYRWLRAASLVLSVALVGTAAVLVSTTQDPRWLRAATLCALVGALLPTLLLRPAERRASADTELLELRRELARLRADVSAFAALPRPRPPEQTLTTLHLPLVRAAFDVDSAHDGTNGHGTANGSNGHATSVVLDLTDALVPETH